MRVAIAGGHGQIALRLTRLLRDDGAEVLADGERHSVTARRANGAEDEVLWAEFARMNPGFEYRRLTERQIPVVLLEPGAGD